MSPLVREVLDGLDEDALDELSSRLKPHLTKSRPPAQAPTGALGVVVGRIRKNELGGKTLAYVDFKFMSGEVEAFTVEGFKLMQRDDGQRWLAIPQTPREKTDPETGEVKREWRDTFKFHSKAMADDCRHAALAVFEADSIPFGD